MNKKEIINFVLENKRTTIKDFLTKLSKEDTIYQRDDLDLILSLKKLFLLESIDITLYEIRNRK